jgi:hypothetical protein
MTVPSKWVVNQQVKNSTVVSGQLVAFKLLEGLQNVTPGDELVGVSMLYLMLCERYKQRPRDVLDTASHILYDSLSVGKGEQTRAIKMFMNMELKDI